MPVWFRRKARTAEQAPVEAAAPVTQVEDPGAGESEGSEQKAAPRRRGTRGGQSARKKQPANPAGAAAAADETAEEKPKPTRQRRRSATPRRSALPKVEKEMLISFDVGEQRVAVLEDGQPVEVYLERPGRRSIAGNVYKGVVASVLPGMEASFVEIGLEKNGFLYVDEIVVPELEGKRHGRRIQDLVSRGQEVLVQAVKDPMGTKGARLTTEISLPGRFLVYTPFGDGTGVSRRLEDDERERLKAICKKLESPEGGIIVRTAAEGASEEELAGDLAFLVKLWATIQGRAARTKAPALVYREAELPLRVVRDLFRTDFERLAIDHERTYRRIVSYLKRTSRELAERVEWYREPEPLMERFGVEAAVRSTLHRRVDLPSGGYLIFDYAEAFTVIDVNTGRFVGGRGKAATGRLEDTITKNNLEAAKEIVRQLRLRDIGGIIVIDFIDMANPKNRQEVEEALKLELERDRTKTYVVEISPLGLVEMTRQNVTDGPREILTKRCPVCSGDGIVVSEETSSVDAERRLRKLVASSPAEAFLVELPSQVAGILIGPAGTRLAEIERETGKRFAFETRDDLPLDHLAVLAQGTAEEIEPKALPVKAGDELELKLEEVHLHHPEDAIARLDGYVVSVADAAGRVGKTVRVRIERATRTVAYATIAGLVEVEAPVEAGILAEEGDGEAGVAKPQARRTRAASTRAASTRAASTRAASTRAPSAKAPSTRAPSTRGAGTRKKAAAEAAALDAESVGLEPAPTEEAPPEGSQPAPEGAAASPGEEKPKKKTRRGTRGGRGRKKPAAGVGGAAAVAGPGGAGNAPPEQAPPASKEEEEEQAAAPAEEQPKKKTRRGTRGGRGRKKPQPAPDGAVEPRVDEMPLEFALEIDASENGASAEGEEPPRKRTRRGTRGGRGRGKPAEAGTEAVADAEPSEPLAASADPG